MNALYILYHFVMDYHAMKSASPLDLNLYNTISDATYLK